MLSDENFKDLDVKGYTVVTNVISAQECDEAIGQYREFLSQFGDGFPKTFYSLVRGFNVGHMEQTWKLRLKTKHVFSQLWKTEKLLTSFDAIAIGRPPEDGKEEFDNPNTRGLHWDQNSKKIGLHAYQGALYLEEQCKDDWTFQVLEGSHKHIEDFYSNNKVAAKQSLACHYKLQAEDIELFETKLKCRRVRVPVPKGGMALWDSRMVHANARPLVKRKHPDRWRFTVFISMTPAIWASKEDMEKHRKAYDECLMTTHWSSQDIRYTISHGAPNISYPKEIPEVARTDEAKLLSGALLYDFKDGQPNGDGHVPVWKEDDDC